MSMVDAIFARHFTELFHLAAELRWRVPCHSGCERLVRAAWPDLRRVEVWRRGPVSPMRVAVGGLIGGMGTYLVLLWVAGSSEQPR